MLVVQGRVQWHVKYKAELWRILQGVFVFILEPYMTCSFFVFVLNSYVVCTWLYLFSDHLIVCSKMTYGLCLFVLGPRITHNCLDLL